MSSTLVLCLLATILSSTTCQPIASRKVIESSEISASQNNNSRYFKDRQQTDSDYLNSVYYDSTPFVGESGDRTFVSISQPSIPSPTPQVIGKDEELYNRYRYSYDTEKSQPEETAAKTKNQEKLFEALRELAFALKAIETKRQQEQQKQQATEAPPLKEESRVYDVKNERFPNFPPFAPELYPKASAGPLSILEELSGSAGSLW